MKRSKYSKNINTDKPHIYLTKNRHYDVYMSVMSTDMPSNYIKALRYCVEMNELLIKKYAYVNKLNGSILKQKKKGMSVNVIEHIGNLIKKFEESNE